MLQKQDVVKVIRKVWDHVPQWDLHDYSHLKKKKKKRKALFMLHAFKDKDVEAGRDCWSFVQVWKYFFELYAKISKWKLRSDCLSVIWMFCNFVERNASWMSEAASLLTQQAWVFHKYENIDLWNSATCRTGHSEGRVGLWAYLHGLNSLKPNSFSGFLLLSCTSIDSGKLWQ